MKNFVPVFGGREDENHLFVAKVLLLYRMYGGTERNDEEHAFVQYMEFVTPLKRYMRLLAVCVHDEVLQKRKIRQQRAPCLKSKWPIVKWFGVEPLSTFQKSLHAVRSNYGIAPLRYGLPWPENGFHNNRFFREHCE